MIHTRIRREISSLDSYTREQPEGFIDIYLGKKCIVECQINGIHTPRCITTLSFYIICKYIDLDLDTQIQSIFDYLYNKYFDPEYTYLDTIENIEINNDVEKQLEILEYSKENLQSIKFGEDYEMHPKIIKCNGYFTNLQDKIVFNFDDFEILTILELYHPVA